MKLRTNARMPSICTLPLLILGLAAAALQGQEAPGREILLAIPDVFPAVEARAILVREREVDVILLKDSDTSPETLDVALRVLRRLASQGPARGRGVAVPITGYVPGGALQPGRRATLLRAIERLQRRPIARVGTLGPGRWMAYQGR